MTQVRRPLEEKMEAKVPPVEQKDVPDGGPGDKDTPEPDEKKETK
jgi:hypothetical protein